MGARVFAAEIGGNSTRSIWRFVAAFVGPDHDRAERAVRKARGREREVGEPGAQQVALRVVVGGCEASSVTAKRSAGAHQGLGPAAELDVGRTAGQRHLERAAPGGSTTSPPVLGRAAEPDRRQRSAGNGPAELGREPVAPAREAGRGGGSRVARARRGRPAACRRVVVAVARARRSCAARRVVGGVAVGERRREHVAQEDGRLDAAPSRAARARGARPRRRRLRRRRAAAGAAPAPSPAAGTRGTAADRRASASAARGPAAGAGPAGARRLQPPEPGRERRPGLGRERAPERRRRAGARRRPRPAAATRRARAAWRSRAAAGMTAHARRRPRAARAAGEGARAPPRRAPGRSAAGERARITGEGSCSSPVRAIAGDVRAGTGARAPRAGSRGTCTRRCSRGVTSPSRGFPARRSSASGAAAAGKAPRRAPRRTRPGTGARASGRTRRRSPPRGRRCVSRPAPAKPGPQQVGRDEEARDEPGGERLRKALERGEAVAHRGLLVGRRRDGSSRRWPGAASASQSPIGARRPARGAREGR